MFHVYAVSSHVCRRMSRSRTWGHCVVSSFCFPLYSPETGSFAAKLARQQMPSVLCLSSSQCWDWVPAHTWLRCCGSHHLSHLPSPHSGFDLHFTNGLPEVSVLFFHLFIGHQHVFSEMFLFKSFVHFPNWIVFFWRRPCRCRILYMFWILILYK